MFQLKITDESCIGTVRRAALVLGRELAMSETQCGEIALIVTELGTNLIKHAHVGGELLLQPLKTPTNQGIEIIALDKGPGIPNISHALKDGYSSTATSGTGLGAVIRLSTESYIYSMPGMGTVIAARLWSSPTVENQTHSLSVSGINVALKGQTVCGDSWTVNPTDTRTLILVADGLGHGPEAATASQLACQIFTESQHLSLLHIMTAINSGLRRTRGAAIAIAEIDQVNQSVRYSGLGNISGVVVLDNENFHMINQDGTAGISRGNVHESVYPWQDSAVLIMHSDGILSRWDLAPYPGLLARHPTLIASLLYRDFNRGTDDTTVVVARASSSYATSF